MLEFILPSTWLPGYGAEIASKHSIAFLIAIFSYLPLLYLLQRWMCDRAPYRLKCATFLWNAALSALSSIGAVTILIVQPEILRRPLVEERTYLPAARQAISLFALTKVVEYGDTVLLLLKKKQLIFLHVYHHLTVALYCWHAQKVNAPAGHHFAVINLCIHSIMYFYYAMAVIVPSNRTLRACRPYITMIQTLQMFVGIFLSWVTLKAQGVNEAQRENAQWALAMYTSYGYLFSHLYIRNYVRGVRPRMTIVIGTLHLLAAIGSYMLWKSPFRWQMLAHIFVGYAMTRVLMLTSRYEPLKRIAARIENLELPELEGALTDVETDAELHRVLLGVMDIWVLWARECSMMKKLADLLMATFTEPRSESSPNWLRSDGVELDYGKGRGSHTRGLSLAYDLMDNTYMSALEDIAIVKTSRASGTRTTTQQKLKVHNLIQYKSGSNLRKRSGEGTEGRAAATAIESEQKSSAATLRGKEGAVVANHEAERAVNGGKADAGTAANETISGMSTASSSPRKPKLSDLEAVSLSEICFGSRNYDYWVLSLCVVLPTLAGFYLYNDAWVGFCILGCLRWILEMHTTGALISDMDVAKFCQGRLQRDLNVPAGF